MTTIMSASEKRAEDFSKAVENHGLKDLDPKALIAQFRKGIADDHLTKFWAAVCDHSKETDAATAGILRGILTHPFARSYLAPGGIRFREVHFKDHLDLSNIVVPVPLIFQSCTFAAGLRMKGTQVPFLQLDDCAICQGFAARDLDVATSLSAQRLEADAIDLTDAVIGGNLEMSGILVGQNGGQDNVRIRDDEGYWTRELEPWVALSLDRTKIAGSLYLNAFGTRSVGKRTEIRGCVSMRNANIDGAFVVSGAKLFETSSACINDGQLYHGKSLPAIRASGCRIGGATFLCAWPYVTNPRSDEQFDAEGAVEFQFAELKDRLIVGQYTENHADNVLPNLLDKPRITESATASQPEASAAITSDHTTVFARLSVFDKVGHRGGKSTTALRLTCARIAGGVQINSARLHGMVDLENAQIGRSIDIRFTKIKAPKTIEADKPAIKRGCSIYADGVRVADSVIIESSLLKGEISMIEADVAERLMMSHVRVEGRADGVRNHSAIFARGATFGAVHLEDHVPAGGTGSGGGRVETVGTVSFAVCRIRDDLRLTHLIVRENWALDSLTDREGLVDLSYAQIGGSAKLEHLRVGHLPEASATLPDSARPSSAVTAVNARATKIGGDLVTSKARIVSLRAITLNLSNVSVGGRWNAGSARFYRIEDRFDTPALQTECVCVDGSEARFGGSVCFGGPKASARVFGSLNFVGATFAHDLEIASGVFGPPIRLIRRGDLNELRCDNVFEDWRHFPVVNLARAKVAGDFCFGIHAGYSPRPIGIVSLQSAQINRLHDNLVWWPRGEKGLDPLVGYWRLDGLHYERLHDAVVEKDRVPWLEYQDPERFGLQPFDQLERVQKAAGLSTQAQRTAIARQNARRRRTWMKLRMLQPGPAAATIHAPLIDTEWREATWRDINWRTGLSTVWAFGCCALATIGTLALLIHWLPNPRLEDQFGGSAILKSYWFYAISLAVALLAYLLIFPQRAIGTRPWHRYMESKKSRPDVPKDHEWRSATAEDRVNAAFRIAWHFLLEGLTGYGHRLRRLFLASTAWVLFAGAMFQVMDMQGVFIRSQAATLIGYTAVQSPSGYLTTYRAAPTPLPDGSKPGQDGYPKFNAYLYSIDLFVPFLEIHQDAYWTLGGNANIIMKTVKIAHIMFGWIALALFAASPFQIFRKE